MNENVVIVTGGARGIGFACARAFHEQGWRVVLADINDKAGERALADIGGSSERCVFVSCDVSNKLDVHNLVAESLSHFGRIDCLINNAGIAKAGGICDLSDKDFDQVINVNLRGAFLVSKAVISEMKQEIENREDRSGLAERPYSIINMSSINDRVAIGDYLAYCVSKGGLSQLTKAMAVELAPLGIRVNAIGPGSIKTDMLSSVVGDAKAMGKIHARTPLGRVASPDEVAKVALFLASDGASYITGETIYVDGGRMALNYTMPVPDEVE